MKKIVFLMVFSVLFVVSWGHSGNIAQAKAITYDGVKLDNREVGILQVKKPAIYYVWSEKKKKYLKTAKKQAAKKLAIAKIQGEKFYYQVSVKGKIDKRYLIYNKKAMTYKSLPFSIIIQLSSPFKMPSLGKQVDYLPVQVRNNYTFGSVINYGDKTSDKKLGEYLPSNIEYVLFIDTLSKPLKKGDVVKRYGKVSKSKRLDLTSNLYNNFLTEGKVQSKEGYRNTIYLDKNYKVVSYQITKASLDFSKLPKVSKKVKVFPVNTSFIESEYSNDPTYIDDGNEQALQPVIPDEYNNSDYNYTYYSFKGSKIDISKLVKSTPLLLHDINEEGLVTFYVEKGYTAVLLILDQNNHVVAYGYTYAS